MWFFLFEEEEEEKEKKMKKTQQLYFVFSFFVKTHFETESKNEFKFDYFLCFLNATFF